MGKAIGKAITLAGDEVVVTFESATLTEDIELRLTSILLQMDGGAEYEPSKMTTASIGCLTDGFELMNISVGRRTDVKIVNTTQGRVLFQGIVVPNSLNQSVSGINDNITIECVDGIGFAQYYNYERVGEFTQDVMEILTIKEIVLSIASRLGINKVAFPSTVIIRNPITGAETSQFELLKLDEIIFFSEQTPWVEDGFDLNIRYSPYAITNREALNKIAESFRMTWVQVGDVLLLRDDIGDGVYKDLLSGVDVSVNNDVIAIEEESFRDGDCQISTIAKNGRVTLTHQSEESISVIPDAFDKKYLTVGSKEYLSYNGEGKKTFVASLNSQSFLATNALYKGYMCQFVAWNDVSTWTYSVGSGSANEVTVYDKNAAIYNDSWSTAIRIVSSADDAPGAVLLRVSWLFRKGVVVSGNTYLYPELDFVVQDGLEPSYPSEAKKRNCYLWVAVTVGGMYYDIRTNTYTAEEKKMLMTLYENGDYLLGADNATSATTRKNIPVLHDGIVDFIIYNRAAGQDLGWKFGFIQKLDLRLKRGYALELQRPNVEYYGDFSSSHNIEVALPIDMYHTLSANRFGTMIRGTDYREQGAIDLLFAVEGEPISMPKRIYRQSNPGDGLLYTVCIDDKNNSVVAYDSFSSPMWSGKKKAVGIEQDIINNSIRLTLV